jgi:hypothetical protein
MMVSRSMRDPLWCGGKQRPQSNLKSGKAVSSACNTLRQLKSPKFFNEDFYVFFAK